MTSPFSQAASREEPDAGPHRGERRVGGERRKLELDPARVADVVRVHPDDDLGVAAGEPPVQGPGDPLSRAADRHHPPVPPGEARQDLPGGVGRAVVHHHEGEVPPGLAQHRGRGGADGGGGVAGRQEDGDARHRARSARPGRRQPSYSPPGTGWSSPGATSMAPPSSKTGCSGAGSWLQSHTAPK